MADFSRDSQPHDRSAPTVDLPQPPALASPTATPLAVSHTSRTIRTDAPPYRWECHCQQPPVLLATYDPGGKVNIKVRDRYWHLYGFGFVQAICPRCAAEHMLDLGKANRQFDLAGRRNGDVEF